MFGGSEQDFDICKKLRDWLTETETLKNTQSNCIFLVPADNREPYDEKYDIVLKTSTQFYQIKFLLFYP